MIKKLIKKYLILTPLILCSTLSAAQVNFKLEHVDIDRVDAVAEKYGKQFSHAKRMKVLKYSTLTIGVLALGYVLYQNDKQNRSTPDKVDVKQADGTKDGIPYFKYLEAEFKRTKTWNGKLLDYIQTAILLGVAGGVVNILWDFVSVGSNVVKDFLVTGNICDVKAFQERHAKLKDLLLKLAALPELNGKQELPNPDNKVFFEIALSDIVLVHRTMVYFLEDMLAFIKFLVTLRHGTESYEFAAVTGNCLTLAAEFNKASDKMASIVNLDQKTDRQAFVSDYALFCRKFTKFVGDCGVSLYGQDFLQK